MVNMKIATYFHIFTDNFNIMLSLPKIVHGMLCFITLHLPKWLIGCIHLHRSKTPCRHQATHAAGSPANHNQTQNEDAWNLKSDQCL